MAVRFSGVIFITDDKTKELRSILERKKEGKSLSDLLGIRISKITAFVVFTNESDTIFNLKN